MREPTIVKLLKSDAQVIGTHGGINTSPIVK